MSHARFQKQQREKARREKAAAKQERRAVRAEGATGDDESTAEPSPPEQNVLADLAQLHQQFADNVIDFDEFEERKRDLLAQIEV
jgi:hypothetical protein